jgi:HEPN domain-containing protein
MAELDKARLVELAEAKLEDAKLLLSAGRAGNAYYLAGYAVELMLKAILSGRFRENTLPDRTLINQLYSHDQRQVDAAGAPRCCLPAAWKKRR